MHELSLAQSILSIVQTHVPPPRIAAVRRVRVDIGSLAGDVFHCPVCGGGRTTVVSGMELRVVDIELADEPEEAS